MSEGYYILDRSGETQGPFTLRELREMWRDDKIQKTTLFAQEGYDDWFPIESLRELFEPVAQTTGARLPQRPTRNKRTENRVAAVLLVVIIVAIAIAVAWSLWQDESNLQDLKRAMGQ